MQATGFRLSARNGVSVYIFAIICFILSPVFVGYAYPQTTNDVPFCEPIDFSQTQPEGFEAAGKRTFSLSTGDPRTVRVIYFVPSDGSFSATVEDSIKRAVRQVRSFFADQMKAHGFGLNAIKIETDDSSEPLIHRVTGQHPDDHYVDGTHFTVFREIRKYYETQANIYVAFIDISRLFTQMGGRRGKTGGEASLRADFKWQTLAHELGHTFGLEHDFRNDAYVMSYGDEQDSLSACAAQFISVHPYFNTGITTEWTVSPAVELISSPKFPPNADNISVQFKVTDTDGLHQLILFTTTPHLNFGGGSPEVEAWRGLGKKQNSEVEFEYRRDIVSTTSTPANPVPEEIHVNAVDMDGNVRRVSYNLVSISPYNYATLEGHAAGVLSVTFSPDAKVVASASNDNTVRLWDVATGTTVSTLNHTTDVTSVSFSPDGTTLASGSSDGNVRLWAVATGEHITTLEGHTDEVSTVTFSPDGSTLASGSFDNTVKLRKVGTGKTISTLVGHTNGVLSVLFAPNGKVLTSRSWDNTVRLWDVATGTNLATLPHSHHVSSVSFSPDGSTLASGSHDNNIRLWDVATGELVDTLEGHAQEVSSVSFSPDGATLASGSADKTVRLWRVDTGKAIAILVGHDRGVSRLLFSPDGTILASTSWDNSVRIWDVSTGESLATLLHSRTVNTVSFSSDGRFLASGSDDKTVELWDMSAWARPRARTVTKISGDNQEGVAGGALTNPLIVEVRDQYGEPLSGAQVTFSIIAGAGSLSSGFTTESATTGPDGRAQVLLTLGSNPGPNTVRTSIAELEVKTFNAVGLGSPVVADNALDYPTWHLPKGATLRLGKGAIGESHGAAAFSPGGKVLAVASAIGVWLYTVEDPARVTLLPSDIVHSVSFTPDGRKLVSAGGWWEGASVRLWDVETQTFTPIVEIKFIDRYASLSPDGRTLAYSVYEGRYSWTINLWDVASGTLASTLGRYDGAIRPRSLTFSSNGATLASGHEDGRIRLWDVETRTVTATLEGHHRYVDSVDFSPDGKTLASVSVDRTVRLWDVASGTQSAVLPDHYCGVSSVAFSPDGAILVSGGWNGKVILWDATTGRNIAEFNRHTDLVRAVSFSPDGTALATASEDGDVNLWDVATGNATTISGHTSHVWNMVYSPDGATLASHSLGNAVYIWDAAAGRLRATLRGHARSVRSISLSSDGTTLASASHDRTVRMWDLHTRSTVTTLPHTFELESVTFSPDGTTLASGDYKGMVHLWNVNTEAKIRTFTGLNEYVRTLLFSPDGATLAAGTDNGGVRLWDVATGTTIRDLEGHEKSVHAMAFSQDGATLATGSFQGAVKTWDLATGKLSATLLEKVFESVAFSPDGTMFATGSQDKLVRLYDLSTGDIIATFDGHNHVVKSVMFSPDGKTLASGSSDGTILMWDLQRLHSVPHILKGVSGIEQKAPAGTVLAQPFVVTVRDENGEPYGGVAVTFVVTAGGGTLSVATDTTDADGNAATTLTLGTQPGTNTVVARVADLKPVAFTAIGQAVSHVLKGVSGIEQKAPAGTVLAQPFVVTVRDENGEPYGGVAVTFVVTAGGGTLSVATDTTDADGNAATTLTLGTQPGTNTVVATVADLKQVAFTAIGAPNPDFNGDGRIGFGDFLLFAERFGLSQDDEGYEARYDLDANGAIGFSDFLIFARDFGTTVGE